MPQFVSVLQRGRQVAKVMASGGNPVPGSLSMSSDRAR